MTAPATIHSAFAEAVEVYAAFAAGKICSPFVKMERHNYHIDSICDFAKKCDDPLPAALAERLASFGDFAGNGATYADAGKYLRRLVRRVYDEKSRRRMIALSQGNAVMLAAVPEKAKKAPKKRGNPT